jgi:hypothetical protein
LIFNLISIYLNFLLLLLSPVCAFLPIFFSILIFRKIADKKRKIIAKRKLEKISEYDEINELIAKTYDNCKATSILPEQYWNLHAVNKIKEYFVNLRADSLKEAINLYEDELLKLKQLDMLNNISELQKKMIQTQRSTNKLITVGNVISAVK